MSSSSICSLHSINASIDIDEYFQIIKEKTKNNFHEIKTKFRNADPDGRGGVSKEAFAHILASILGPLKPLSHQNFLRLVEKMGLKKASLIRFYKSKKKKNYFTQLLKKDMKNLFHV